MPLYGFFIQKSSAYESNFKNQYYCEADNITIAHAIALQIVEFERAIFSTAVTFDKVHTWGVKANPAEFIDQDLSGTGELPVTDANAPQMCLKINFNSAVGYGGYKNYRTHWDNDAIFQNLWSPVTITSVIDAIDEFSPTLERLTTRSLVVFTSFTPEGRIAFQQLSKRWYNRADTEE